MTRPWHGFLLVRFFQAPVNSKYLFSLSDTFILFEHFLYCTVRSPLADGARVCGGICLGFEPPLTWLRVFSLTMNNRKRDTSSGSRRKNERKQFALGWVRVRTFFWHFFWWHFLPDAEKSKYRERGEGNVETEQYSRVSAPCFVCLRMDFGSQSSSARK